MRKETITFIAKTTGDCLSVDFERKVFEMTSYYGRHILANKNSFLFANNTYISTKKKLEELRLIFISMGYIDYETYIDTKGEYTYEE